MVGMSDEVAGDETMWHIGVFDAHCHPTDIMASIESIARMRARVLTVMSTRAQDQELVAQAARRYPVSTKSALESRGGMRYVIPAFGWHPWFSYQLYDQSVSGRKYTADEHYKRVLTPSPEDEGFLASLPQPRALSEFLEETEKRLQEHPLALIGEVGLDRAFRIPVGPFHPAGSTVNEAERHSGGDYTPGSREGKALTPYRVSMKHQKTILEAQLKLAAKLQRPVSVHSVQAQGVVFELLQSLWAGHEKVSNRKQKRRTSVTGARGAEKQVKEDNAEAVKPLPYPPRICMHSYSGPADPLRQYLHASVPADVYFSFSEIINFSNASSAKVTEVIRAVPDTRILVESDLHCAGQRMDELLKAVVGRICDIKGWTLEEGTLQLKQNWEKFIFGN